ARQLECHSMERAYNTILVGGLKNDSGTVTTYIGRSKNDRKKMAVVAETDSDARRAVTHYTVFERVGGCTYAEMRLETGRTHQIRVHMSYLGHPVLGDPVYGGMSKFAQANEHILNGQCLHARTLGFEHPVTGENMRFDSGLPEYFTTILEKLRAIG
nr:RluA family pseudouridine synthase [Clostridia bacterium]